MKQVSVGIENIKDIIATLRKLTFEDRKATVDLFPPLDVVPISHAGQTYLLACDSKRLHIFRSLLLPGTMITVQNAPCAEQKKVLSQWKSTNGGVMMSMRVRRKGDLLVKS